MLFAPSAVTTRHFTSYVGTALPLRLVGSLEGLELDNRNTFIRAFFDAEDRLLGFEKWVYGEIHLIHRYGWNAGGGLDWAEVTIPDEETTRVQFAADGRPTQSQIIPMER